VIFIHLQTGIQPSLPCSRPTCSQVAIPRDRMIMCSKLSTLRAQVYLSTRALCELALLSSHQHIPVQSNSYIAAASHQGGYPFLPDDVGLKPAQQLTVFDNLFPSHVDTSK
jgi:hypothetical protein